MDVGSGLSSFRVGVLEHVGFRSKYPLLMAEVILASGDPLLLLNRTMRLELRAVGGNYANCLEVY